MSRVVVVGGAGHIGSLLVARLRAAGHDVLAASRRTGVDAVTGTGLDEALPGCEVVVDVSRSPSLEDAAAWTFFTSVTTTLLAAERRAGVGHHVALTVVGARRMAPEFGFMAAKVAQEELVAASPVPFTIVAATQFFEFLATIADVATHEGEVRLPPLRDQPIAARDLAGALAGIALAAPVGGTVEVAGPDVYELPDLVARLLAHRGDARRVVADPDAPYFAAHLQRDDLLPGPGALLGETAFDAWLAAPERTPGRGMMRW